MILIAIRKCNEKAKLSELVKEAKKAASKSGDYMSKADFMKTIEELEKKIMEIEPKYTRTKTIQDKIDGKT